LAATLLRRRVKDCVYTEIDLFPGSSTATSTVVATDAATTEQTSDGGVELLSTASAVALLAQNCNFVYVNYVVK